MRKGYFIRSVSKSFIDVDGTDCDPFRIPFDKGRVGALIKVNHTGNVRIGALRVLNASLRYP